MRVTTCVFLRNRLPGHLDRVAQRRPQPLQAEILNRSSPKLIQTVLSVSRRRNVSIMTELHFTVRVKRSGLRESSAMTRTAGRPARGP